MTHPDDSVGHPVGSLARIDQHGRVALPVRLLRCAPWWKGKTCEITTELLEPGRIRLFGPVNHAPLLEEYRLLDDGPWDLEETFADRYRVLKLYDDGRLTIPAEVSIFLDPQLSSGDRLFVEAFEGGLSVMSTHFRTRRLADHRRYPPLPIQALKGPG